MIVMAHMSVVQFTENENHVSIEDCARELISQQHIILTRTSGPCLFKYNKINMKVEFGNTRFTVFKKQAYWFEKECFF